MTEEKEMTVADIQYRDLLIDSIDLERFEKGSMPLLMDHDPTKQVGVIEDLRLDQSQRKLRARARFGNSTLARETYADVIDQIRTNVSIGYNVNDYTQEKPENRSERPIFRVTDWSLLEISSVSIPSDFEVGVGRSDNKKPLLKRIHKMEQTDSAQLEERQFNNLEVQETEISSNAVFLDHKRQKEITEIAGRNNLPPEVRDKAVFDKNCSVADFRGIALDWREKEGLPSKDVEETRMGMSRKEVQSFSIARLLWAEINPHDKAAQAEAEGERETVREWQKFNKRTSKGIMVPNYFHNRSSLASLPVDVLADKQYGTRHLAQRDWNTTDATGGYLIQTDVIGFIERLRHYLFLTDVGITELRGLRGPINIPRLTASQTAYWVAEGGDLTESQGTLDQVALTPKTVGCFSQVTRRLLEEAKETPDVETLIVDDMAKQIAAAIQDKALSGDGSSNTPTGLYNSSISTKTCADQNDPTWAEVIDVWSTTASNRALSLPRDEFAWACPSTVAGNMMAKSKDSGSGRFVMEDDFRILSYPVMVSELCSQLTFGAWKQLIIAYWSGLDLLSDPYTAGKSGTVNFYALQDVDVAVRLPTAFCKTV
jgi:HK97 family phage major capsid protein